MCCDTTECGAQNETVGFVFARFVPVWQGVDVMSHNGESSRYGVMRRRSTLAQLRQSTQLQMKPVRQCVRRGAFDLDVAQASPLFSDHAPREVHLWQ